ncbi:MAG TPA: peptidylprolyl isomerase [Oculatellaceae cyanobacterium]
MSTSLLQGCMKYPEKSDTDNKTGANAGTTSGETATASSTGTTTDTSSNSTSGTGTSTSTGTGAGSADTTTPKADTKGDDTQKTVDAGKGSTTKSANGAQASKSSDTGANTVNELVDQLPEIKAASMKVDIHNMPDTDVICTVRGTPISVGDYKNELKFQEQQVQSALTQNGRLTDELIDEAKKRNITLSETEKKKLIDSTNKAKGVTGKLLENDLKKHHITDKEYEDTILKMGLAAKTFATMARERLLNELVDKQLVINAATDKNYYKTAFNHYIESKSTPEFKQLISQTGLSEEEAKKRMIDQDLLEHYMQYLKDQNSTVTDAEIQKVYDENKDKLKHGEEVKLAQIVLAAPSNASDQPGMKEQLKQRFPKLSDKDLDTKAAEFKKEQKRKADDLLQKIQKGEKFEELANEYTEDPINHGAQNGGEIGWKDKTSLEPDFVAKVGTLKPGQVYPHVLPTRFGYHILKLVDKRGAGITPLADVRSAIKTKLTADKQQEAIKTWLSDQHKSGNVRLSQQFKKLIASGDQKTQ